MYLGKYFLILIENFIELVFFFLVSGQNVSYNA